MEKFPSTSSSQTSGQTATLELRSLLAQSVVPVAVTHVRALGYDEAQVLRYGPVTREKAVIVQWTGVPVEVTDFVVEYLDAQGRIIGLTQVEVRLLPGQTVVLDNPVILSVSGSLQRITITPSTRTIARGTSTTFTATGIFSDGSTQDVTSAASWGSGDATLATVRAGVAEGRSPGSTTVKATLAGVSAQAELVVTNATLVSLDISPKSPAIAQGTSQGFTAEGFFSDGSLQDLTDQVQWTSSNPGVAQIVGSTVQGFQAGQTTIAGALGEVRDETVLTVTSATLESLSLEGGASRIALGISTRFSALGRFSDNTTQDLSSAAVWEVQPSTRAEVNQGQVTGRETGFASVTATFAGRTAEARFEVTDAVVTSLRVESLSQNGSTLVNTNQTLALRAMAFFSDGTERDVTGQALWTSDDGNRASVAGGVVTGQGPGQAFIRAQLNGLSGALQVTVQEAPLPQMALSGTYTFNTDTGELTPEGGNGATPPGWNSSENRLILDSFTLESGAVLNLTGSNAFRVKADTRITIAGLLDFHGQDGAAGIDGMDLTNGTNGGDGENGGDINLFSSGDLTVTGTINVNGGNGGDGGGFSRVGITSDNLSGGNGGRGGDSGEITLTAGDNANISSAQLLDTGGKGGIGGNVTLQGETIGDLTAGAGGHGGQGGTLGGDGGSGGTVIVQGDTGGESTSGAGGDGGRGGSQGGNGGIGGSVLIAGTNSGLVSASSGGNGGPGGAIGGNGGNGGNIEIELDNLFTVVGGAGGNGGNASIQGGSGGDGGSITVGLGSFGFRIPGAGGTGGFPNGVNGSAGTNL